MISNEEKMLKERIQFLLSSKKMPISKIAKNESDRVMLGRQINAENTIVPYTTLYRLLYMFHDIDANWLMLGEGQMEKVGNLASPRIFNTKNELHDGSNNQGTINLGTTTIPYPIQALLDEKDKRIAELEKMNDTLQNVVRAFTSGVNNRNSDAD